MLEFTRSFFRGCPDLRCIGCESLGWKGQGLDWDSHLDTCLCSTVSHSSVRQKFLTQVGRDHLEPEEKQALKRLVEEELLKMQVWV